MKAITSPAPIHTKSISLTHQTGMLRPYECLLLLCTSLSFSPAPPFSAHHNVVSRSWASGGSPSWASHGDLRISIYEYTALTDVARHAANEIKQAGIGKRL